MAQREWADKDYYADLGVSSSASQSDIKHAYRTLARENHPDKNPGDTAAEARFKRAAEAYDVLGDENKRKEYDEMKSLLANGGFGSFSRGFGRNGGAGFSGGFQGTQDFDISDVFRQAAGGQGGGFSPNGGLGDFLGSFVNRGAGARQSARQTRGSDVETAVTLDFREAALGTTVALRISGDAPCTDCHGSGSRSAEPVTCTVCNGTGFESESRGAFGMSRPCSKCKGTGTVITDPCPTCNGSGVVQRTRNLKVRIPAGVVDAQRVRLAGQGAAGRNGLPAGDLIVTVHVRPDPVFTRAGDDLEITVPVSFAEATLGETITVPTLEKSVRVKLPAGTPNGRSLRVRGRGVKGRDHSQGDLLVTVKVEIPKKLNADAMSALRAYAQAERKSGFDPRANWKGND